MKIADICTTEVVFIDHEENLQVAAQRMREGHVGMLVVTGHAEGGIGVMGIVTDRDIAIEAVAQGVDARSTGIGRITSPGVATVSVDAGISAAIELMKECGVRRLLVASEDGHVRGIVSSDDLLAALGREVAGLAHALRKGIDRETLERKPVVSPVPAPDVRIPAYRYA